MKTSNEVKDSAERWSTGDVIAVTGFTSAAFQRCLSRGIIRAEETQNPGSGRPREYSNGEVVVFSFMKMLMDSGLPPSTAFGISNAAKNLLLADPESMTPPSDFWVLIMPSESWPTGRACNGVTTEDRLCVAVVDSQKTPARPFGLLDTLRALSGKPVITVNISAFRAEVRRQLAERQTKTP